MMTISDSISRVRNIVKAVKEDAFLTDRFIYSLILKYAKLYIRRLDNEKKIMRFQSLFETLPCVELIEVDKIEACCSGIKSKCTIMRTKNKVPDILNGSIGPLFRDVTSLDGSVSMYATYPSIYTSMANTTTFKYNTFKYYWYADGHLYFPNIVWESVRIEGLWADSINYLKCDNEDTVCKGRQEDPVPIPDYIFAEIEQAVLKDLGMQISTPVDAQDDKQSPIRS